MDKVTKMNCEKLYLYKGEDESDDIFVEDQLQQHHKDGLRFLYKQFKNKNPGVILNSPLGYGNTLQVALFLGAIRHLLAKPILILCEDSKKYDWLDLFQKLPNCYNVVVDAPNPFVKKSIFIDSVDRAEVFARRSWGALVAEDAGLRPKVALPPLEADFKVWITPLDMKENLQKFSSIYKWLCPREQCNLDQFKSKPHDRKDMITKAILLETFLEDKVFRTTLPTPFENLDDQSPSSLQKLKNKDATGTKVKRLKRTHSDTALSDQDQGVSSASAHKYPKTDDSETVLSRISHSVVNISEVESDVNNGNHSDNDVESFIRDEEPIRRGTIHKHLENMSNDSQDSKTDVRDESLNSNGGILHMDSDTNSDSFLPNPKSKRIVIMSSESDDSAYELETQEVMDGTNIVDKTNENISKSNNSLNETELSDNYCENEIKINSYKDSDSNVIDLDDKDMKPNDSSKTKPKSNVGATTNSIAEIEVIERHENDDVLLQNDKMLEQMEKPKNGNDKVDLDSMLTKHEDTIFKKFKGTLLDSLF